MTAIEAPPTRRPARPWHLRLPAIRQHSEMDCGAACLATLALYWGKRIGLNRMRDHARVGRDGASLANLRRAAIELGFDARSMKASTMQLADLPLPAIANWKGQHWVVVHHVGRKRVKLADPAIGLLRMPRAEFDAGYSGYCLIAEPGAGLAEQPDDPGPLRQIVPWVRPMRGRLTEVALAALSVELCAVSVPLVFKVLIDTVIMQGQESWLTAAILALAGVMSMSLILTFARQELAFSVAEKVDLGLSHRLFDRLLRLPLPFFQARKSGDIISRMEEQNTISDFLTEKATGMLVNLIAAVLYLAIMLWFNVTLALLAAGFIIFHVMIARFLSPRLRLGYAQAFERGADAESHIVETLRGLETLKSAGATSVTRWRYDDLFAASANAEIGIATKIAGARVGLGLVGQMASVTVLFAGALLIFDGQISIGVLVAFTMFTAALFGPLEDLVGAWDDLQDMFNAVERIDDILGKTPEFAPPDAAPHLIRLPQLQGALDLRDLAFRYHPDDTDNVLQNVNLEIPAGQHVALVGRSGCGKSTLLRLIFGLNLPSSGRILFDGFDQQDLYLPSLRRQIGVVPQTPMIFAASLRDNLCLGRPEASKDAVHDAMAISGLDQIAARLPGGLDAPLQEAGRNLSGGQRQRVAIARAVLQDPAILILDEGTAALDTRSEAQVMAALAERFTGRTILSAAHRASTVRRADRIVVLNRGLVAEDGAHAHLIKAGGLYARLYAAPSTDSAGGGAGPGSN